MIKTKSVYFDKVETMLSKRGCELVISDVLRASEGFFMKNGWKEPYAKLMSKRLISS